MRLYILTLGLFIAVSAQGAVQETATNPPAANPAGGAAPSPQPAAPPPEKLKVVGLSLPPVEADTPAEKQAEAARQSNAMVSLGDSIILKTNDQFGKYLEDAAKQRKVVTLYLNGNDTLIAAEGMNLAAKELRFQLQRNSDNKAVWAALLRDPFKRRPRPVDASVGMSGGIPVEAEKATFHLVTVKWAWYAWAWLVLLLLVLVFVFLERDMLRDFGSPEHPYSLGRCQMAWWFFLVLFGYVLIWLISGDQDTITPSLLALMGISAATAVGSVAIDNNEGISAATAAKQRDFLTDILSDSEGHFGLHRFQIVVWTVVLGIIFLVSVTTALTMPVFSPTLLATMGISAGTYLGFKFPER